MKTLRFLLLAFVAILPFGISAIELIQFRPGDAEIIENGTEAQLAALKLKVEQILGRNSSAAGDPYCAFIIKPTLNISDVKKTEGLTRNVTLATSELVLSAVNAYDETIYYNTTIPLETAVTGSAKAPADALISVIKVKDPAFTRFLRNARKKIQEYYDANCERIIVRAINMHNQGHSDDAMAYLAAVSDVSPCYSDAADLMTQIARMNVTPQEAPDSEPETAPEPQPENTPEPAPETVPEPAPAPQPQPAPTPEPAPTPKPAPAPTVAEPKIYMSDNSFSFKILSCIGSPVHRNITITCELTNLLNENVNDAYTKVVEAYSADGQTLEPQRQDSYYYNFPSGIKTKKEFSISVPDTNVTSISFIKIRANRTDIEIRDLEVKW